MAAHRSSKIAGSVRQKDDGNYEVTLHEAGQAGKNGVSEPTGRTIRLTVTPELPALDASPGKPAFAQLTGTAWAPVLEKAIAGIDQTWTPQRQAAWERLWPRIKQAREHELGQALPAGPAPSGYARLNQGSTAWDRAELLAQLTGEPAEAQEVPTGSLADWRLAHRWRTCLDENKPVLVGTRPLRENEENLPNKLEELHAYEVTAVIDGRVHLRNPWNEQHPEPLTFTQARDCLGTHYTTLK